MESINKLVGKVLSSVVQDEDDELIFTLESGEKLHLYHSQDCCETVRIDKIIGNLGDLVGSPILAAEETIHRKKDGSCPAPPASHDDSWTWTLYRFETAKGVVEARWFGTSNGYYSEEVSFGSA